MQIYFLSWKILFDTYNLPKSLEILELPKNIIKKLKIFLQWYKSSNGINLQMV
jgi:hypothetical protein